MYKGLSIFACIFLLGCQSNTAQTLPLQSNVESIISPAYVFPKYLFTDTIPEKYCTSNRYKPDNIDIFLKRKREKFVDHLYKDKWHNNSTSLTVNHDALSDWWGDYPLMARTSVVNNYGQQSIINELLHYADNKYFLKGRSSRSLEQTSKCWQSGINSNCDSHISQHRSFAMAALIHTAIILKPDMNQSQIDKLDNYFKQFWKHTLNHRSFDARKMKNTGFYEFGDQGTAVIMYANWFQDYKLLEKEFTFRTKRIKKYVRTNGYIDPNSYRGVRAYFYHTLGADSLFSYALLARTHGYDLFKDPDIGPRLKAVADVNILGLTDYTEFRKPGNRGKNHTTDMRHAIFDRHSLAINLPIIMKREFNLSHPMLSNSYDSTKVTDKIAGFDAKCYYETMK